MKTATAIEIAAVEYGHAKLAREKVYAAYCAVEAALLMAPTDAAIQRAYTALQTAHWTACETETAAHKALGWSVAA